MDKRDSLQDELDAILAHTSGPRRNGRAPAAGPLLRVMTHEDVGGGPEPSAAELAAARANGGPGFIPGDAFEGPAPTKTRPPARGRADPPPAEKRGLATTCLSTVRPVPVRWLVPGYLPLGKMSLLAGDGGHGKSTVTLGLAAAVTTGRPAFGLDYAPPKPAEVLLISCEDDVEDTIVPRLLAAGADLGKVFQVNGVEGPDGKVVPFNMLYYESMEAELDRRPDVRLVIIDPAGAYVGGAGVDDHKDSDLRALLGPMCELAARRAVAILLIKHLNRNVTAKAAYRVMGSAGYVNTVRSAFLVAPDDQNSRKLFLPLKFNIGIQPPGLAYRLQALTADEQDAVLADFDHLTGEDCERLGAQLFRVEWLGPVPMTADEAVGPGARADRDPTKVEKAMTWLEEFLASHAYPSKEVLDAAMVAGFTFDNVKEAKARLKGKRLRASNRGRFQGEWWSGFGPPDEWVLRPDPNGQALDAHSGESGESEPLDPGWPDEAPPGPP